MNLTWIEYTNVFISEKKFFSHNLKKGTKYKPNGERFFVVKLVLRELWIGHLKDLVL